MLQVPTHLLIQPIPRTCSTVGVYHCTGRRIVPELHPSRVFNVRGTDPPSHTPLSSLVNLIDPFYSATALHFDDLLERYGTPVYVLNLVKVCQIVHVVYRHS